MQKLQRFFPATKMGWAIELLFIGSLLVYANRDTIKNVVEKFFSTRLEATIISVKIIRGDEYNQKFLTLQKGEEIFILDDKSLWAYYAQDNVGKRCKFFYQGNIPIVRILDIECPE
jgi:hypothetical protein